MPFHCLVDYSLALRTALGEDERLLPDSDALSAATQRSQVRLDLNVLFLFRFTFRDFRHSELVQRWFQSYADLFIWLLLVCLIFD